LKLKVLAIARASRNKTEAGQKKMKAAYLKLIAITSRVVGDAKKFAREIAAGVKKGNRKILRKAKRELEQMIPRVKQVLRQTRERVVRGNTKGTHACSTCLIPDSRSKQSETSSGTELRTQLRSMRR
jgi:IS5 family transposase